MGNYYVYILTNRSGTLYTGMTNDLLRRMSEHKQRLVPGFTKRYKAIKLLYYEHYTSPAQAIAREKTIKGWTRKKKIELIEAENPRWRDLTEDWSEFQDR